MTRIELRQNGQRACYWNNFLGAHFTGLHNGPMEDHDWILKWKSIETELENWGARLVWNQDNRNGGTSHLEFEREQDAAMFLLRWA